MAESRNYTGGCHCGEVRFEVTADISSVVSCNCSICQKRGALWVFVPADKFALRAGLEDLKDYQFGKKSIHHEFCPQCGVGAFSRGRTAQGAETVAVNVRCLDDLEIAFSRWCRSTAAAFRLVDARLQDRRELPTPMCSRATGSRVSSSMSCWRRAQAIAGDLDLPEGDTLGRRAGGMQGSGQV